MLAPLVDVTSNYIISGEAKKCQENVAEFAAQVMQIIDCFEMGVDIQLSNPAEMIFSMYLYKINQPIIEITVWANSQAKGEILGTDKIPIPLTFLWISLFFPMVFP